MTEAVYPEEALKKAEYLSNNVTDPLPDVWEKGVTSEQWSNFYDTAMEYFNNEGIIEYQQDGSLVVDTNKVINFSNREYKGNFPLSNSGGVTEETRKLIAPTSAELFANVFNRKKVKLKGRENEGEKELFYIPESAEDLANIEEMKNSWMSLDEVGRVHDWNKTYPTRKSGFKDGLNFLEVAVPYKIYAKANGERDENGVLWVDSDPGDPNTSRQPFSGKWMVRQKIKGPHGSRFSDSPRKVIEEYGALWQKYDLLKPTDIQTATWDRNYVRNVTEDGRVTIDSKVYSLGKEFAGGKVEQLDPDTYIVQSVDGVVATLKTELTREELAEANVVDLGKGRRQLTLPKTATKLTKLENMRNFSNYSYEGHQRRREIVNVSDELPKLLELRKSLDDKVLADFSKLDKHDQIRVSMLINDLGVNGRGLEFIEKTGEDGMKLLADMKARGGTDRRLIGELLAKSEPERVFLLEQYRDFRVSTDKLMTSLFESAKSKIHEQGINESHLALIERTSDAIRARSADLLHVASTTESISSARRMKLLTEGTNRFNELLLDQVGSLEFNYMPDPNQGAETGRYIFKDGSSLSITVRPKAVENAQARISIRYKSADGEAANLRIDKDEYGISLDISNKGDDLYRELEDLGKTYHSQGMYERGLQLGDDEFAEFAEVIPILLNWPHD